MDRCNELLREALEAGHVVGRDADGEHLEVRSYNGRPLSAELRSRLVAGKSELLRYLERREAASEMLVATFVRLTEVYSVDWPVSGMVWQAAERRIDDAFRAACERDDTAGLEAALADYERFALSWFAEHGGARERGTA